MIYINSKIIILCEGQIIFDGTPKQITNRLMDMGFDIPRFTTSIDYLMKIIDKDEIKIQYENTYGEVPVHDPRIIDKLYRDRINILMTQEKKINYFSKKNLLSNERSNFKSKSSIVDEDFQNTSQEKMLEKTLISSSIKKGETLLDYEARNRNQKRWAITQTFLLTWISMVNYYKQLSTYIILLFQVIFSSVIFVGVYYNLGDPEVDTIVAIQNRLGFIFMITTMGFMTGVQSSLLVYLKKKKLFLKDKDARIYDQFPFFVSQLIYTMPMNIFVYAIVIVIYYFGVSLNSDPHLIINMLFSYFFLYVGAVLTGKSFSAILSTLGDTLEEVAASVSVVLVPVLLCAGFMGNLRNATLPIKILSYLSPLRFAFQGMALVEFQNKEKYMDSCVISEPCRDDPSKKCSYPIPEGSKDLCNPMKVTDFYQADILTNMLYLIGLLATIRLLGFFIFLLRSSKGKMKYKKSQTLCARYTHIANDFDVPRKSKLDPLNQLDSFIKNKIEEIKENKEEKN